MRPGNARRGRGSRRGPHDRLGCPKIGTHHLDDAALNKAFDVLEANASSFEADRFSLYVHEDGEGWVPTRDYLLTAAADE